MDEIVEALDGASEPVPAPVRQEVLRQLHEREIDVDEAVARLEGG